MKRIEVVLKKIVSVLFCSFAFNAFAEVKILSPATSQSRVWSNKQVLLINANEDEEIFYSFSDQDPMTSGFAYDGPVTIDLNENVKLNIATIKDKKRIDYVLNYDVDESKVSNLTTLEEKKFIEMLSASPIFNLKCGEELVIPETFEYILSSNDVKEDFETGRSVYVSSDSNLERFLTLTLKAKSGDMFNYVIHVVPDVQGEFTQTAVPFEFDQWSTVRLTDHKFIYSVDDGWWQGAGKEIKLDRTKSHTIKWQNVDYDNTNPVSVYVIPPVPSIRAEIQEDSTVIVSLTGDESFRFAKGNKYLNNFLPAGLYTTVKIDAFQGENFSTLLPLDIYSENVLQGTLFVSVQVNRKMPVAPEIVLVDSSNDKYNIIHRQDVTVSFSKAKEDYIIKYLVEGPFYKKTDDVKCVDYDMTDHDEDILDFKTYNGQNLKLTGSDDKPCAYKIYSYVIDKSDNVSKTVSEFIQIDKCNFFVNPSASSNIAKLGTLEYPFDSLENVEEIVNNRKFTNFYIEGVVPFVNKNVSLKQNVRFSGNENSKVEFNSSSSFIVNNASIEFNNIVFDCVNRNDISKNSFILINNSTLEIKNSEINFSSAKNATLIDAQKSSVLISDSGLNSSASEYASVISGLSSKIAVSNSRLTTNAVTNVNISVKKSELSLKNSECKVSGNASRIAELYTSVGLFESDVFAAENVKNTNEPVWKDRNSKISKFLSITLKGFSN